MLPPRPHLWAQSRGGSGRQRTGMRPHAPTLTGPCTLVLRTTLLLQVPWRPAVPVPGTPTPRSAAPTRPAPGGPRGPALSPGPALCPLLLDTGCPPVPCQGTSALPAGEGQLLLLQSSITGPSDTPPPAWPLLMGVDRGPPATLLPPGAAPLTGSFHQCPPKCPPLPGPVWSDVRLPTS